MEFCEIRVKIFEFDFGGYSRSLISEKLSTFNSRNRLPIIII